MSPAVCSFLVNLNRSAGGTSNQLFCVIGQGLWNVGWKVLRGDREFVDENFRGVRSDNDRIVNLEVSSFP